MTDQEPKCLYCGQTRNEIPLVTLIYRDESYWICPSHLPILIHTPRELIGKLPGADKLTPHEH